MAELRGVLIYWEGDNEGAAMIYPGLLDSEDVAEETQRMITDGTVEVEHVSLRVHRHKWCERNGFNAIESDGEWHDHYEMCPGEPNFTVARIEEEA